MTEYWSFERCFGAGKTISYLEPFDSHLARYCLACATVCATADQVISFLSEQFKARHCGNAGRRILSHDNTTMTLPIVRKMLVEISSNGGTFRWERTLASAY